MCVHMTFQCTVLWFVVVVADFCGFFVALYDLSSGLDELGRSRSLSVVMLVER